MTEDPMKLFPALADQYPQPDSADTAYGFARAGLQLVPGIGSAAAEVISIVLAPSFVRRQEDWFKKLADLVEELKAKVDAFNLEDLTKNEEFVSATVQATRIAMATHLTEKHTMLRNALFNIAAEKGPNDDLQQVFFNAIDEFTPSHVKVLKVLWTGTQNLIRNGRSSGIGTYQHVIEKLLPDLKNQQSLVQCILTDLRNRGFTTLSSSDAPFEPRTKITNLGIEFLQFVLKPEEIS